MLANMHSILQNHVSLTVSCIDRIYLNGYVPKLHTSGQRDRFRWFTSREASARTMSPPLTGLASPMLTGLSSSAWPKKGRDRLREPR